MLSALRRCLALAAGPAVLLLLTTAVASADGPAWTTISDDFQSPLFGLAVAPGHRLMVADAGAGPTELRGTTASLAFDLPGVTDVAPIGRGDMLATVSSETEQALYRVSRGHASRIADLGAFETAKDPAGDGPESNPFDLARTNGGNTFVADAAGNDILAVDNSGHIDWVAVLPKEDLPTAAAKQAAGCPHPSNPDLAFVCDLPDVIPADPVPTTVAVGPDGFLYAGELKGFPANQGTSRIWRIDPAARHVNCGTDPGCTLVNTGPFTSIIDLNFGPDGTAYVVELDEASFAAFDFGIPPEGGTVNACTVNGATWSCTEKATGLPIPTAVAIDGSNVYVTLNSLVPGQAQVALLP
ncbi:MAG: ScyD/ScyE family protein [Chloroflexi bacterium]|nr:MAG: ScyD/ScyE family protein [Chloroflexota bacterium]